MNSSEVLMMKRMIALPPLIQLSIGIDTALLQVNPGIDEEDLVDLREVFIDLLEDDNDVSEGDEANGIDIDTLEKVPDDLAGNAIVAAGNVDGVRPRPPITNNIGTRAAATTTEERGVVATITISIGIPHMTTARASATAWETTAMAMSTAPRVANVRSGGSAFISWIMCTGWIAMSTSKS
eukprot:173555_1